MRILPLAGVALLASATAVFAAPASVNVAIGQKLQAKAAKTYGVRETAFLADDLRASIEKAVARTRVQDGARIDLTIVDAVPNRPTFKQLGDTPGLSMQSFGIGGAKIEGTVTGADGTVTPVSYKYYENDIVQASWAASTWSDAQWAFDKLGRKLALGREVASR